MTDIEIVRKCAERMGYSEVRRKGDEVHVMPFGERIPGIYWPLEDRAQCMEMVERFNLCIDRNSQNDQWTVYQQGDQHDGRGHSADLRLAICECVANLPEES